jgi:hypothetical protein
LLSWEVDVEIYALRAQGWTISAIARHVGADRKTVRYGACQDVCVTVPFALLVHDTGKSAGEGDFERAERGFPPVRAGALDQPRQSGAYPTRFAALGFPGPRSLVFDVADREPDQLDDRVVGREMTAVPDGPPDGR